jgi:hypothetical protein
MAALATSRRGDWLTRAAAVGSVLAVAAVAAWISYLHAVQIVSSNGEPGMVGRFYPATIDGVVIAASMVLLDAARHEESAPRLAWWMLAAGIGATVTVNVLAGVAYGPLGAVVSAWPAAAFVAGFELLTKLVRAGARRASAAAAEEEEPQASEVPSLVPSSAEAAAEASLRETLRAGNPWSVNALSSRWNLPRKTAAEIHDRVMARALPAASLNGNAPHE